MRGFPVLAAVYLAGCEVATRNAIDLEFLSEVESLIDAEDRCGLYRLVRAQPGATRGSDALAMELRDFVASSRGECQRGEAGSDNGGPTQFPDIDVIENMRNGDPGSRDAQAVLAEPSSALSTPSVAVAGSGQFSPFGLLGSAGPGRAGLAERVSGASKPGDGIVNGTVSSGRRESVSVRDDTGLRGEGGSGSRNDDKGQGKAEKERAKNDRDRERADKGGKEDDRG